MFMKLNSQNLYLMRSLNLAILIFSVILSTNFEAVGQDYDRMSKSELREGIYALSRRLDSISILNRDLSIRKDKLEADLQSKNEDLARVNSLRRLLENEIEGHKSKENEISELSDIVLNLRGEINAYKDSIAALNRHESALRADFSLNTEKFKKLVSSQDDSIKNLLSKLLDFGIILNNENALTKTDDFLNNYFENIVL